MSRMINVDDLMSSSDVADLLGVGKAAVSNWKQRYSNFPAPVATVSNGKVDLYLKTEIVEWTAKHFAKLAAFLKDNSHEHE